jgi:MSHA pilin protein MshD
MSGSTIVNSLNETIQVGSPAYNIYQGFSANVVVVYDENLDGIDDGSNVAGNTKLITVTVTTPSNEQVVFSTYRTNY